jgi:hypothetical protein
LLPSQKRPKYLHQSSKHIRQTTFETIKTSKNAYFWQKNVEFDSTKVAQNVAIALDYFCLFKQ